MNDEKKTPFPISEVGSEDVKVVQDIFDLSVEGSGGGNVFEEDIFAPPPVSPPPAPKPTAPAAPKAPAPPPTPKQTAPAQPKPPAPQKPPEETDADIKVVGAEDFERFGAPGGLTVTGITVSDRESDTPPNEYKADDDLPEFVMTGADAQEATSPAPFPPIVSEPDEYQTEAPPAALAESAPEAQESPLIGDREPPQPKPDEGSWEGEWGRDTISKLAASVTDQGQAAADADVPMVPESDPVMFKAAKAKEGAEAVRQTQEFIEHLDGEDHGFLDAAEIQHTIKIVSELQEEIRKLKARIEALEARLK